MRGWHFVAGRASHEHTYALMRAELAGSPLRSEQRLIEHEVVAAATLSLPTLPTALGADNVLLRPADGWEFRLARTVASGLVAQIGARGGLLQVTAGVARGSSLAIGKHLQTWAAAYFSCPEVELAV